MNDLPAPDLACGIQPPATVYATLDQNEPVYNTLVLDVMNASTQPLAFNNSQGLTPSSDLPAISDTTPNPLDRLYVWFPWGDGAGDLSSAGEAGSIGAESLGPGWSSPVQLSDPTIGVYWILFPLTGTTLLGPQEVAQFEFDRIVTALPATQTTAMTIAYVMPRVGGWASPTWTTNVFKREPLTIASFTALPSTVLPGETVTATWSTTGADEVGLEPGDHTDLPQSSHLDVPVSAPTTFRLTAYAANQEPVEQRRAVSVQSGWVSMTGGQGPPWGSAQMATLLQLDGSMVYVCDEGTWSSTDGRTWTQVAEGGPFGDRMTPYSGVFDGKLWVMGGLAVVGDAVEPMNDIWCSADGGATWEQAGTAQWSPRTAGGCTAFLDQLFIAGGTQGDYIADVPAVDAPLWVSPDGTDWQNADVPWGPRTNCGMAAWNDRLWVAGGATPGGFLADTWSTADGNAWEESPAPAPWGNHWPTLVPTSETLYAITHFVDTGSALWALDDGAWAAVDQQPPPFGAVDGPWGPIDSFGPFLGFPMAAGRDDIWVYVPPS
jgi:hypothetical protein